MNVQELIKYLQTLPSDTKVTCCDAVGDYYLSLVLVDLTEDYLDYTSSTKTLKIGT